MSPDKSLAEILANRMYAGEPLPLPLTLSILRQVCDALDYAHTLCDPMGNHLGIIHRDVNPACIFVGEGGRVTLVASTAPRGTFAYMAPEYVMTGMLDARGDLFALGVVAYEMLTNRPLFATGDDRETLDRVCQLPIYPPSAFNPRVAPEIDGIVLMALAREPAYRWQYASMMRDGLRAVAERLGLDVAMAYGNPWGELFGAPPAPAPPVLPNEPPPSELPPSDPDLWADDTNQETRIQPGDPALRDVEPPAPVAQAAYAAAPVEPAPHAPAPAHGSGWGAPEMGVAPVAGRRSAPTPASAQPAPDQFAPEMGVAPVAGRRSTPTPASAQPAEMGVAPVAGRRSAPTPASAQPAPDQFAPEMGVAPVAGRRSAPTPASAQPAPGQFSPEMGVAPVAGRRSTPTPASAQSAPGQFAPEMGVAPVAGRRSTPTPASAQSAPGQFAPEMGVAPVAGRRSAPTPASAQPALDLFAPEMGVAPVAGRRSAPTPAPARSAQPRFAPEPVAVATVLPDEVEPVKFAGGRSSTSSPAPAREPAPAPAPARGPGNDFDPELGPEPTQIGAMPLISFGDAPLVSSIGEKPRAPAPVLPQPSATFLPEAPEPPTNQRKKLTAIIGLLVIVALVIVLLIAR